MRACKLHKMYVDVYHLQWQDHSVIADDKKSKRHRAAEGILSPTLKASSYRKKTIPANDGLIRKAVEGSTAYHSIKHDFSFRSNDSTLN